MWWGTQPDWADNAPALIGERGRRDVQTVTVWPGSAPQMRSHVDGLDGGLGVLDEHLGRRLLLPEQLHGGWG